MTRSAFEINDVCVAPGSRRTVDIPMAGLYTHTPVTLPVHVVHHEGRRATQKVRGFIEEGTKTAGATAHVCSAMPKDPALRKGLFIQPVIFTGLTSKRRHTRGL